MVLYSTLTSSSSCCSSDIALYILVTLLRFKFGFVDDGGQMAGHPASVHVNVPLVDLPLYIRKGNVLRGDDGACIGHLRVAFHNVVGIRAIVRRAQETLSYLTASIVAYTRLVQVNVITLLSVALLLFSVIAAEEFFRDHVLALDHFGMQTSPWTSLRSTVLAAVAVMAVLIAGPWYGNGGPAWAGARLLSWPFKAVQIPDGPRGWPVLGSWRLMQGSNMHRNLAKRAWDGGTSTRELMALSVGATRIVLSSDPKVAKQILQSPVFGDRPLKQAASNLGFARAIGFAVQGPQWRHLRKLAVTHMFSRKQIATNYESLQREASRMVSAIANDLPSAQPGGARPGLRLRPYLQRTAVNNITTAVFGRHFSFGSSCGEAEALEGMIREGFELLGGFNCADHLPFLRHLRFLPFASRCRSLATRVRQFVQSIIDERRLRHDNLGYNSSSFVDVLLSLEGDQKLPDDDMISVLWEMVFRGTDTIAVLTEWALAEVILNPRIQRRIHKELDDVVGQNRRVQHKDIDQLPYLQAIVKETLRSHPPGPLLSWARLANEDTQVAGHHVPRGTTAMVNMWAITHDATVWPNPYVFDPSRFLKDEGGVDLDVLGTDLRLAPFGSGRRVCPGRALGVATAQLWLACLLHHFSWSQDPDHPIELTDNLKLSCEMASPLHACAVVRIPQL